MDDASSKDVFNNAYSDYYATIYSNVYASITNKDDVDDICQEIFLIFFHKLDTIKNRRTWLLITMKNVLANYYRKKKSTKWECVENMDLTSVVRVNDFKDTGILLREAIENIHFTDVEKNILNLVLAHQVTQEKAAELFGMTRRQVRYRLETISRKIINYLKKKGIKDIWELL